MDIRQLQDKIGGLELQCLNHNNMDVRHQWAVIAEGYMINDKCVWSQIDDETTLHSAIADAERILNNTHQ